MSFKSSICDYWHSTIQNWPRYESRTLTAQLGVCRCDGRQKILKGKMTFKWLRNGTECSIDDEKDVHKRAIEVHQEKRKGRAGEKMESKKEESLGVR